MPEKFKDTLTILRRKQVQERTGLPASSLYSLLDKKSPYYDPTFPKQIKLSVVSVGWIQEEIQTWIESRICASRK
jgi:prophage regulatory protein